MEESKTETVIRCTERDRETSKRKDGLWGEETLTSLRLRKNTKKPS